MAIQLEAFSITVWPFGLALLIALVIFLRVKNSNSPYLFCVFLFGVYLLFAIDTTLFPIVVFGPFADAARATPFGGNFNPRFNFIPLPFLQSPDPYSVMLTSGRNVILTLPFGFGLPFLIPLKGRRVWWAAFFVGISFEALQLLISFAIGYLYRVIDVNDVLCNALGFGIGYGVFRIFTFCCVELISRWGNNQSDVTRFLYTIARRSTTHN